jgi:carbon monoxide dehydrogenase subunit G
MKVERELQVAVPIKQAWETLVDTPRVAACLGDGEVRRGDGGPLPVGSVRLTSNGSEAHASGFLRAIDLDEDDLAATYRIDGREVGGPALGRAIVHASLHEAGDATRVVLAADYKVTGHRADANAVDDVARALLADFATRIEQQMRVVAQSPAALYPDAESETERVTPRTTSPDAPTPRLPRLEGIPDSIRRQGWAWGVGVAAAIVAVIALRRRGRSVSLVITYRR